MPFAIGGNSRIRTNISAENAYNALEVANRNISLRQLRLSTGKRINNPGDDVAGYITSRALQSRNGAMKAALLAVSDAYSVTNISIEALDNISQQLMKIKDTTSQAASGALGTDEIVSLAKAAYRMAQQIQTIVDTTVYGGRQLLDGTYSGTFVIGMNSLYNLVTLSIDLTTFNPEYDIPSNQFDIKALSTSNFAGVTNLNLSLLNSVNSSNLGIFSSAVINLTITSLNSALQNINKVASLIGGISNRLSSQEDLLKVQITNYNAAISRIEDADVALEQLELIKSQFLQQSSLISLAQANANPQAFLQLIRG
ncbi:MAG: flagellin [Candidatus Kapaibacteriales bacterium]